mgnify:CR=1 FL=1
MSMIKCNRCGQLCGLLDLPTAAIPKDNDTPIGGVTQQGVIMQDIRLYCHLHYVEPAEE